MAAGGALLRPSRPTVATARGYLAGTTALAGAALLAAAVIATRPDMLRVLAALLIVAVLGTLCLARPRAGVYATCAFLIVLALLRRVLIPYAGWSAADPLLLVGPLLVGILLVQLFVVERRSLGGDRVSRLVLAVIGVALLEMGNPAGGGLLGGVGGFLFMGIPLLWFLIGREVATDALVDRLLDLVLVAGVAVGLYGLLQTELGYPSWDRAWYEVTGYTSLSVGGTLRAFSTFSSSAEYSLFLGAALVVAAARVLQGRAVAVLAMPPLAIALFLSSSRGPLVTAFFAIVVLAATRTRRPVTALVTAVVALGASFGTLQAVGGSLDNGASNSGNNLVSHQVGGITDPLNQNDSTLIVHLQMVQDGIVQGVKQPLGRGTGATNQAGSKATGGKTQSTSTEVDISNAFVSFGLIGGLLYLALFVLILARAARGYFRGVDLCLPVLGVLIVTMGQWLTGGHYALSPITWILIGWLALATRPERLARLEPSA